MFETIKEYIKAFKQEVDVVGAAQRSQDRAQFPGQPGNVEHQWSSSQRKALDKVVKETDKDSVLGAVNKELDKRGVPLSDDSSTLLQRHAKDMEGMPYGQPSPATIKHHHEIEQGFERDSQRPEFQDHKESFTAGRNAHRALKFFHFAAVNIAPLEENQEHNQTCYTFGKTNP